MGKEINKKEIKENRKHKNFDKGQIFVKIMAGILAIMMVMSVAGSLIYYMVR